MTCMKTIGILGGMGPLATVDLFTQIIMQTKADNDAWAYSSFDR